jgi:glutathionyl-hydroquinone reductase
MARAGKGDPITNWVNPSSKTGEFKRQTSSFRNDISADGEFPPESGRYRLYVSWACPWAHRSLIVHRLKNLQKHIPIVCVHWHLGDGGWRFATESEKDESSLMVPAPELDLRSGGELTHLLQLYKQANPDYGARATVPILFDTKTGNIVNNESAELVRILGKQFNSILEPEFAAIDISPDSLLSEIDRENEWIYTGLNNGVYRAGFATTQEAYSKAVTEVFATLDKLEKHFTDVESKHPVKAGSPGPYYFGDKFTETDIRLFTTLIRFDPVYVQHFKCNIRDIRDGYPAVHRWLQRLYWLGADVSGKTDGKSPSSAFGETTNFQHIKFHYTKSHKQINPFGITPDGPVPNIRPL